MFFFRLLAAQGQRKLPFAIRSSTRRTRSSGRNGRTVNVKRFSTPSIRGRNLDKKTTLWKFMYAQLAPKTHSDFIIQASKIMMISGTWREVRWGVTVAENSLKVGVLLLWRYDNERHHVHRQMLQEELLPLLFIFSSLARSLVGMWKMRESPLFPLALHTTFILSRGEESERSVAYWELVKTFWYAKLELWLWRRWSCSVRISFSGLGQFGSRRKERFLPSSGHNYEIAEIWRRPTRKSRAELLGSTR